MASTIDDEYLEELFDMTAKCEANFHTNSFDVSVFSPGYVSPASNEFEGAASTTEYVLDCSNNFDVAAPTAKWSSELDDIFGTLASSTTKDVLNVNTGPGTAYATAEYISDTSNEQDTPSPADTYIRHAGVQQIDRHAATSPPYFLGKGRFTEQEKLIIRDYCLDTPHEVLRELQRRIPGMTKTYNQVKGAVENERRKRNRRLDTGPWRDEELHLLADNLHLSPKQLTGILKEKIAGCEKNIDQVRDMKLQLRKKQKTWAVRQQNSIPSPTQQQSVEFR